MDRLGDARRRENLELRSDFAQLSRPNSNSEDSVGFLTSCSGGNLILQRSRRSDWSGGARAGRSGEVLPSAPYQILVDGVNCSFLPTSLSWSRSKEESASCLRRRVLQDVVGRSYR